MNDMTNDFGRNPTVENIPLAELTPFRNHPFKVKDDAEMAELIKSIADFGVLVPALARPTENGYELISGHRRMAACKELGLETMPVIIRDMTDKEAIIAMVDSNLQREHILPSEKAFAYKMKYDAMKHQGTSRQLGTKLRTDEIIAEKSDDSARQIQRYIRLTNLIPELLTMMDEGKIAFSVGVELSYLDNGLQYDLLDIIQQDDLSCDNAL
jgi:ParB family chromosome partitioning protein